MSSGGITYHLRARRYARQRWRPLIAHVAEWLRSWRPPVTRLVIFGSSAGYTLNSEFLERFDRITIVEPDLVARFLFRRRFARVGASSLPAYNLLQRLDESAWRTFVDEHPDTAFLFSNVVGQMIHIGPPKLSVDERVERVFALMDQLAPGRWASYHDILSTSTPPHSLIPFFLVRGRDTIESIAREKFRGDKRTQIVDHGTLNATLTRATDAERAPVNQVPCAWWEIEPLRYHLIAWLVGK